jgi:hypothetical protein
MDDAMLLLDVDVGNSVVVVSEKFYGTQHPIPPALGQQDLA